MRDWYQREFFPQDVATLKDEVSLIKDGKIFSRYSRNKPGAETDKKLRYGIETVQLATGTAIINQGAVLEQTKKLNDTAIIDPLIGFTFDRRNVESKIAQLSAVTMEVNPAIGNGLDDLEKMLKIKTEK